MTLLGQKKLSHYVIYHDGRKSELMDRATAHEYASIFGGTVYGEEPTLSTILLGLSFSILWIALCYSVLYVAVRLWIR